ncbi:MAG TPA: hemin uptake protein HemP [Methyloversatilis sp.]
MDQPAAILQQHAGQPAPADGARPAIDSARLLDGHTQVTILHGSESYSLRLTKNGKLILTK